MLSVFVGHSQKGQGKFCVSAEPLCGSNKFSYPNTSGYNLAEQTPDYGCLTLQLNPSWFYLQIAQDGDIELMIEQSTTPGGIANLDVDFIVYGPFKDPVTPCANDLTGFNVVDCSYKLDNVEFANLTSTKAGEYYLMLITNFSRKSGFITVTQVSGAATTNCVLVKDPISINKKACQGDNITLNASAVNASYYKWFYKDSNNHFIEMSNSNSNNIEVSASNIYKAEVYNSNHVLVEKYEFNTMFYQVPQAPNNIIDYNVCDILDDNDGIAEIDLQVKDNEVLNGLAPNVFSVSYYKNQTDAYNHTNALPNNYINSMPSEVIYVRINNINMPECFSVSSFIINVIRLPKINLEPEYILCENTNGTEEIPSPPTIDTGLNSYDFSFTWVLNNKIIPFENKPKLIPLENGIYSVEITNIEGCSNTFYTEVTSHSPPIIKATVTSKAFSDNHSIEINTSTNDTDNEFSLDGGLWQKDTVFNNVSFGEHIIRARNIYGCGINETTVMVIDYPHYFTPNGDGVNDKWNIVGLHNQTQAKIQVFDRYGKLLKELKPYDNGWDGTFKGENLPDNDYWFVVEYTEPKNGQLKQYKSHFALKR
ncbi:T9SS type B sorting domain-containing protein [Aestuariibaculum suncheonense]|uniref:T9SS type B sorting domain-containing protein n=2 Tax=Aestuariibaculum suncheonense TaxID=1028745 RepID=A0A8J6QEZ4_9FLAO|nr:T9SS type B sorting domain-containing protein [Aestuariibaculum suncheonense]